jgi:HrpA-like RNA helicase
MKKLLALVPIAYLESQNLSQSDPKERIKEGLKQLEQQAQRINLLSAELERSIWEFQTLANQVNQDSRFVRVKQRHAKRFQISEYRSVRLPTIRQIAGGRFVVTSRYLDFKHCDGDSSWVQKFRQWIAKKTMHTP